MRVRARPFVTRPTPNLETEDMRLGRQLKNSTLPKGSSDRAPQLESEWAAELTVTYPVILNLRPLSLNIFRGGERHGSRTQTCISVAIGCYPMPV